MLADDDREYHTERARAELDRAYRAESSVVAEAHLKLSSLHMQRLQAATGRKAADRGVSPKRPAPGLRQG